MDKTEAFVRLFLSPFNLFGFMIGLAICALFLRGRPIWITIGWVLAFCACIPMIEFWRAPLNQPVGLSGFMTALGWEGGGIGGLLGMFGVTLYAMGRATREAAGKSANT